MSFGFGNNTSSSTGFGGFGNSNNTTSGFGSTNNTSSAGGMFGANNNTATSGGFGGFGSGNNTSNPFGQKPQSGFGATATTSGGGGGLFGSQTATSGGFGTSGSTFGANNTNTANTSFGSGNTGGGLFGSGNKPSTGFGASNTTGGSIFGTGNTSTGGFGNSNNTQTTAFGGNNTSAGFGGANTSGSTGGFGGFGASNNTATANTGTASTPFQQVVDKDPTSNQTAHFQSITFQQPYIGKSFEELRVEDYVQGRRFGNSNGQAGSFGASTGFGGSVFGNNNSAATTTSGGGLFGSGTSTTNTTGGFGGGFGANNNNNTTGGFGNTNTGGLFGSQNNQPKAGGLFGNTASSGTATGGFGGTAGSTGGLFGSTNTQSTGFGANNTQQNTAGGLFGSNNNNQPKPAFGGFGGSNAATTGFGNNNNSGGGLFGSSTNTNQQSQGGGLFGANNNQQQNNTGGGLFGANNQQSNTSGGLFGSTQNKPASTGLFGSSTANTNTAGGLFGANNNQQQNAGGGLFGSNNQQTNTGGGLFGSTNNNQPKPGGLFGSTAGNTNSGGGLFGSNNQQSNTGGGGLFGGNNANSGGTSLFGGNNQNQNRAASGGLFGSTSNTNAGGGLFGSSNNQNQQSTAGGGLFGSTNQNANSMFGQSNSHNQNQQNQLHASLTLSPYGNDQLFSSLGQSATPVGPLATPLVGAKPTPSKAPSLLSSTRLNSPIYTPRASTIGRNPGYGFTYSTYGTPNSSFSGSLTPQASSLLKPTGSLGSALTSKLAKSMSMNNLRGTDTPSREGDSLLRPTPGSASSRYLEAGKMRRLTIDRNLRTDLFAPPEPKQVESLRSQDVVSPGLSKKVSFDNSAAGARQTQAEPSSGNALVRTETSDEEDGSPAAGHSKQSHTQEMQQVNGASLTDIPEDGEPFRPASAPNTKRPTEKAPTKPDNVALGDYYTKPSIKDLRNMSRTQLQNVGHFVVGREGCGYIEFSKVDLSNVDLDSICGGIVNFTVRSATVYPDNATKPERGKGLNVPSTIHLLNSWPRDRRAAAAKSGPAFDRHVARLHKIKGTEFVKYDADDGIWTFKVQHFTTYGLDEDDEGLYQGEDDMEDVQQESSVLSDPPTTPHHGDETMQSIETAHGELDDTFNFKKSSSRGSQIPGGFDQLAENITYDYDDPSGDEDMEVHMMSGGLGSPDADVFASNGGAVQAPSPGAYERHHSSMALDEDTGAVQLAEDPQDDPEPDEPELPGSFIAEEPRLLRSILKPSTDALSTFASPEKLATDAWEDQLHRTMSPRKRDRHALRNLQQSAARYDRDEFANSPFKRSMLGHSQLGQSYLAQKSAKKVGFNASTFGGKPSDLGKSQAFKTSMDIMNSLWTNEKTTRPTAGVGGFENPYPKKPRLSANLDDNEAAFHASVKPNFTNNGTLIYSSTSGSAAGAPLRQALTPVVSEHAEIRFVKLANHPVNSAFVLENSCVLSTQRDSSGFTGDGNVCPQFAPHCFSFTMGARLNYLPEGELTIWQLAALLFDPLDVVGPEPDLRKRAFTTFWSNHVAVRTSEKPEEQALFLLTKNDTVGAAQALLNGGNHNLAMAIAQLPGTAATRQLMQSQINAWRNRNDWSEMSDAIRALWSIIAGETCTVRGKNGPKEDRVEEFSIAERFDINWKQSLGLRIYFGGHDSLSEALTAYTEDLANGREVALPTPWWSTQDNPAQKGQEDTMLGLLRVFASSGDSIGLEAVFEPKTVSGSHLNNRLAWQLALILRSRKRMGLSDDKMDALTSSFAAEAEWAGDLQTSAFILTHLENHTVRENAMRALIMRNGRLIPDGPLPPYELKESDEQYDENEEAAIVFGCRWSQLASNTSEIGMGISPRLLWESKAQYAATLPDEHAAALQVEYLINAELYGQAQAVISEVVGPKAIIEQDYDELERLLNLFPDYVGRDTRGANTYPQFCALIRMHAHEKASATGLKKMEELLSGLRRMKAERRKKKLEEMVAVEEMERVVLQEMKNAGHV